MIGGSPEPPPLLLKSDIQNFRVTNMNLDDYSSSQAILLFEHRIHFKFILESQLLWQKKIDLICTLKFSRI